MVGSEVLQKDLWIEALTGVAPPFSGRFLIGETIGGIPGDLWLRMDEVSSLYPTPVSSVASVYVLSDRLPWGFPSP